MSAPVRVTDAMVHAFDDAYSKNWEAQRCAPEGTKEQGTFFATRAGLEAALSAQPSPGGQGDDSPMAKMAAALRGKAEAERAAFDQRVQSGEWGPMPDNPDVLELPPLPEEVDSVRCMIRGEKGFAEPCDYYFTSKQMRDYARANMEPLRAEVERLMGCLATANANHEQFERQWYLERDRAERLAEALRGMLDVAAESFANRTYVPINCQQAANAYAALAQEDRNG